MIIAKWIFTVLFLLASVLTLSIALNDQGASIYDWMNNPVLCTGIILGLLTSFFWFYSYKKKKHPFFLFGAFFPFLLATINLFYYYQTQQKINKDYFLLAINPDEHAHQFEYYFRSDSTLKTHGIFFWNEGNSFQTFSMRGDTIFLDTILQATGIQSKIYLKSAETDAQKTQTKLLIPLDNNYKRIDTLTKFIIKLDK